MSVKITTPLLDVSASFFTRFKGWIVGLTSVLIVLPALIHAGVDLYSEWRRLPRTGAEEINIRLNAENFGKEPIMKFPVPVKQNNGTVEVRFAIYEKGDVRVEFGKYTQWFPFPLQDGQVEKKVEFRLVSSAFAQGQTQLQGRGDYQETEKIQGETIQREKTFENGVVETQVVDPRSGDILNSSSRKTDQRLVTGNPTGTLAAPKISPIDLDQYRRANQAAGVNGMTVKDPATKMREHLVAELERCMREKSFFISRYLCEYKANAKLCDLKNKSGNSNECDK